MRRSDTELRAILEIRSFDTRDDLVALLPASLPAEFTTGELATEADVPRDLAQRMAYCLRHLDLIIEVGRTRRGIHYRRR